MLAEVEAATLVEHCCLVDLDRANRRSRVVGRTVIEKILSGCEYQSPRLHLRWTSRTLTWPSVANFILNVLCKSISCTSVSQNDVV